MAARGGTRRDEEGGVEDWDAIAAHEWVALVAEGGAVHAHLEHAALLDDVGVAPDAVDGVRLQSVVSGEW